LVRPAQFQADILHGLQKPSFLYGCLRADSMMARGTLSLTTEAGYTTASDLPASRSRTPSGGARRIKERQKSQNRHSCSIRGPIPFDVGGEAYATALGRRRVHEFADRREHGCFGLIVCGELFLDAGFELIEAFGEFLVRAQELAQLYEGANDVDAHLDGPWAIEDSGSHDGAVLGERIG
jgi:hypothetical protein